MEGDPLQRIEQRLAPLFINLNAWPAHKQSMQQELLAHFAAAYEEEKQLNPDGAEERALQRLGNPQLLVQELQQSISPTEQHLARWLFSKDSNMANRIWIAAAVTLMILWAIAIPDHAQVICGALGMLCILQFLRFMNQKNGPFWWTRTRFLLLAGLFAFFFGAAIILPALAHLKHPERFPNPATQIVGPLSLGILITLTGIAAIAWSIRKRILRLA